jgi:hypothetical protein
MPSLTELIKESSLGLTLGKRKTLESELLKLRATPEAARERLRQLGLPLDMRQKIEAVLQLDDRPDDLARLAPAKVPAKDAGFTRAPLPEDGSKPALRVLVLHGFGANNGVARMQLTHLGLHKHGVACDYLRSSRTLAVDAAVGESAAAPAAAPATPTSTALVVKEEEEPVLLSQRGKGVLAAFEQVAKQHEEYQKRYDALQQSEAVEQRKHEWAHYLGQAVDVDAAVNAHGSHSACTLHCVGAAPWGVRVGSHGVPALSTASVRPPQVKSSSPSHCAMCTMRRTGEGCACAERQRALVHVVRVARRSRCG